MTKISGNPGGNAAGVKRSDARPSEDRQQVGSFNKAIQNSKGYDWSASGSDGSPEVAGGAKSAVKPEQGVSASTGRASVVYETTKLMDLREFASLNAGLQSGYAMLARSAGGRELPTVAIVKSNAVGKGRETAQVIGNTIFASVPVGQPGQKAEISDELSRQVLSLAQSCLNLKL